MVASSERPDAYLRGSVVHRVVYSVTHDVYSPVCNIVSNKNIPEDDIANRQVFRTARPCRQCFPSGII